MSPDKDPFSMMLNFNRELGSLSTRVEGLERRLEEKLEEQADELKELKAESKLTNEKLDSILKLVDTGRASWKTVTVISTVIGAIFTFLVWLAQAVGPLFK